MRNPEEFPKALYLCTFVEIVVFTLGGAVGYHYIGDQWMTSPAYGSLEEPYVKVVAAFTLPTLIVSRLESLAADVSHTRSSV